MADLHQLSEAEAVPFSTVPTLCACLLSGRGSGSGVHHVGFAKAARLRTLPKSEVSSIPV